MLLRASPFSPPFCFLLAHLCLATPSEMANLQERLDKAFGALNSITDQPAWKPSAQQIFRSGAPPDDVAASSDEEYEEKQRRESVPGKCSRLERLQGVIGVCLGWWKWVGGGAGPGTEPRARLAPPPPPATCRCFAAAPHTPRFLHCRPSTVSSG